MATPRKPRSEHLPTGRPSSYREEYCTKVVEHMKAGNSFWSFAAVVSVSMETLSNWTEAHPEFLEAKKVGLAHLLAHDEANAKAGTLGRLKRLDRVTEYEKTNGDIKREKFYSYANFAQTYQIFLMKNRYPDLYRDKREIETRDGDLDMTPEQRAARIEELLKKRKSNGTK